MARRSYEDALVEWAQARLAAAGSPAPLAGPAAPTPAPKAKPVKGRTAKGKTPPRGKAAKTPPAPPPLPEAPAADGALGQITQLFALGRAEEVALQLAWAVERWPQVARAARAAGGGRGLCAWMVDAVAGEGLLGAGGKLRAHGLLRVETIPGGLCSSLDEVRLAPGVAARLQGAALEPESLGIGVERIGPSDRGPLSETLAALVRDDVLGSTPRWVAISGISSGEADKLAAAIARRIARPAVRVDGRALSRLPAADAWALLAAARREADLAESALLVDAAAWLGPLLRALCAPPPGVTRVLLTDERKVPELVVPPGFTSRLLTLEAPAAAAGSDPVGAPRPEGAAAPPVPVPPSIEAARRQAAVDAARAMGRTLDLPPIPSPTIAPLQPLPPSAPPPAAATPAPSAAPAQQQREEPPMTREERMRRAEQFVGSSTPARRRSPAERAAAAERAAPPPPPVEPPPPPPTRAPAPSSAAEAGPGMAAPPDPAAPSTGAGDSPAPSSALATGDPSESLPYVPIPEDATLADLLRIVREAPNPFQRAALMRQLADAGARDVQLVALLRAFLTNSHPAVRAAAEYGMTRLFGPNWNRTRAIPKPVQPPRSDDGNKPF